MLAVGFLLDSRRYELPPALQQRLGEVWILHIPGNFIKLLRESQSFGCQVSLIWSPRSINRSAIIVIGHQLSDVLCSALR